MSTSGDKLRPSFEKVADTRRESFRLFTWDRDIDEVDLVTSDNESSHQHHGMGSQWHYHPEVELTYITMGEGLRFVGDDISPFSAPQIVLLGSQLPHYWKVDVSSGTSIQFRISPESPLAALREFSQLTPLWERAMHGILFEGGLFQRLKTFFTELIGTSPIKRVTALLDILDQVNTGPLEDQVKISQRKSPLKQSSVYQHSMHKAIDFMTTHFDEDIRIEDVLQACGLSRATFSRHFSQAVGHSYTSFLQSLRIENARRLIAIGEKSITEAALDSGFQNLSHFNRVFKKRWNCTPAEFRRRLTGPESDLRA